MGSYAGHVLPGSFFIIFGLWWWFNILAKIAEAQAKYFKRHSVAQRGRTEKFDFELDFESSVWMKVPLSCLRNFPVEPCLKVIACTVGIIAELSKGKWNLLDNHGHFSHLNNFGHATMFGSFLLGAIAEIFRYYNVLFVPSTTDHVLLSMAFFPGWGVVLLPHRRTQRTGSKATYSAIHCCIFHRLYRTAGSLATEESHLVHGALISRCSPRYLVYSDRSCVVRASSLARHRIKPRIRSDCFCVAHTGFAGVFPRQSCCNWRCSSCILQGNKMVGSP